MATFSAVQKPAWTKAETRDMFITGILAIASWSLLISNVLPAFTLVFIIVGAATTIMTGLGIFLNVTRKRNATLFAEMNTERWQVKWWGQKPLKSVWGTRLSALHNQASLDMHDVEDEDPKEVTIRSTKVGRHNVFEFKANGRTLTLPERLANTDGVRDFLLAWIAAHDNQVPAVDRETMQALIPVLNRGRELEPSPEQPEKEVEEAQESSDLDAALEPVLDPAAPVELAVAPEEKAGDVAVSDEVAADDPFADYIAALEANKAAKEAEVQPKP